MTKVNDDKKSDIPFAKNIFNTCKSVVSDSFYSISVWLHRYFRRDQEHKGGMQSRKKAEQIFLTVILAWPVLHFLIFYVGMNANSIIMAFMKYDTNLKASFVGLENFGNVIKDLMHKPVLLTATKNSLLFFIMTNLLGLPLNLFFSYFIYKKVRGHSVFQFVLFLPSILSAVVLCLVFKIFVETPLPVLLRTMGIENVPNFLVDSSWAFPTIIFYSIFTGFATGMVLYSNAMSRIPEELIEYGCLEGVGMFREMWNVILPMIYPTLSTMIVMGIAGIFASQGPLYMMYGDSGPEHVYTLGYFLFVTVIGRNANLSSYPYAAAAGILMTLMAAPLTLLVRYLMEKYGPEAEY